MLTAKWRGSFVARSMIVMGLILVSSFVGGATILAQTAGVTWGMPRAFAQSAEVTLAQPNFGIRADDGDTVFTLLTH